MTAQEFQTLRAHAWQNRRDAEFARDRAHAALEAAEAHLTRCRHLEHLLISAKSETPTPAPTPITVKIHHFGGGEPDTFHLFKTLAEAEAFKSGVDCANDGSTVDYTEATL